MTAHSHACSGGVLRGDEEGGGRVEAVMGQRETFAEPTGTATDDMHA